MFKYTYSATLDTLDLIKKAIYIADIGIQLFYILYLGYRVTNQEGIMILNIALLVPSIIYLIYHIVTTREFYTNRLIKQKTIFRNTIKILKYAINLCLIIIAVMHLYGSSAVNDNMTMLMTVLMICGYMFSILFDVILIVINKQVKLIEASFRYDIGRFTLDHEMLTFFAKKANINLEELFPKVSDKDMMKKIQDTNYRQEQKANRKDQFKRVTKGK